MSYIKCDEHYKRLVLEGMLPYPHYYPYNVTVPNLSNPGCENMFYNSLLNNCYYDYNATIPYYPNGDCHNPTHFGFNNLSHIDRPACDIKYDYYCYDRTPYQDPSAVLGFTTQNLVSNIPDPLLSRNYDTNLSIPWGIIIMGDIVWVANTGSGLLTSYDLSGRSLFPIINVFGPLGNITEPTGIAFNNNLSAFHVTNGPISECSHIITVTRDGTIHGYNCNIDCDDAILLIDNSKHNSVYTGITVVTTYKIDSVIYSSNKYRPSIKNNSITTNPNIEKPEDTFLYATDFYNQKIDVYDGNLKKIEDFHFIDEFSGDPIPEGYSPYNIANIGDYLYVLYAKQNSKKNQYEFFGTGHGYISIFSLTGNFIRRFYSRGVLNTPWGIIQAPSWFGYPPGSIMVANYGDGIINIFDCDGKPVGKLADRSLNLIYLEGLRGLVANPNYEKIVYWTATPNNLNDAFIGTINTRFIT